MAKRRYRVNDKVGWGTVFSVGADRKNIQYGVTCRCCHKRYYGRSSMLTLIRSQDRRPRGGLEHGCPDCSPAKEGMTKYCIRCYGYSSNRPRVGPCLCGKTWAPEGIPVDLSLRQYVDPCEVW